MSLLPFATVLIVQTYMSTCMYHDEAVTTFCSAAFLLVRRPAVTQATIGNPSRGYSIANPVRTACLSSGSSGGGISSAAVRC